MCLAIVCIQTSGVEFGSHMFEPLLSVFFLLYFYALILRGEYCFVLALPGASVFSLYFAILPNWQEIGDRKYISKNNLVSTCSTQGWQGQGMLGVTSTYKATQPGAEMSEL